MSLPQEERDKFASDVYMGRTIKSILLYRRINKGAYR